MHDYAGFNDQRLGPAEWKKREKECDNAEELDTFAAQKVRELKSTMTRWK